MCFFSTVSAQIRGRIERKHAGDGGNTRVLNLSFANIARTITFARKMDANCGHHLSCDLVCHRLEQLVVQN